MREASEITFGSTTIPFSILRSKRRKKTVEITLDPSTGVVVSAPMKTSLGDITRIVHRRAGWIIRKSTQAMLHPRPKQFVSGESIPYLGRQVRIFVEDSNLKRVSVHFDHWSFRIATAPKLTGEDRRAAILRAITKWYKQRAHERLTSRTNVWSEKLGCDPLRVLTRDQRQRWGSCAPDGTIRFNWRAVMAEPALIDYIVVHELLHLKIRNHGREFWSVMAGVMPDYKERRTKLRELGRALAF